MKRHANPTFFVFGVLGGLLFLDLVLPVASLFFGANWAGWLEALRQPAALQALMISIETSAISMAIMTLLGIPLGYLLARANLPWKRFWICLVFLPMVMPDLAAGILLLKTFGPYGIIGQPLDAKNISLTNNLAGIVLAQLFVGAPFVIVSALSGFAGVDPKLELAAATLGDSQWHIFRRISLPLASPAVVKGFPEWASKAFCLQPGIDLEDPHGLGAEGFVQLGQKVQQLVQPFVDRLVAPAEDPESA